MSPIAVCLVGHEDWGKSETLYHLVGRSRNKGWIKINNIDVFVRHMSNDDIPESFIDFINKVTPERKRNIVVALCPNFSEPTARTEHVLRTLRQKHYDIHFWVLQFKYGTSYGITLTEIDNLRAYGQVEIYAGRDEAEARARLFSEYLTGIFHA